MKTSMLALTPHPEGWVLPVRAQPGARKRGIQGERAGALRVAVTAPPQDGRANEAIADYLEVSTLGVRHAKTRRKGTRKKN